MPKLSAENYLIYTLDPGIGSISDNLCCKAEIFWGMAKNFYSDIEYFKQILSRDERNRAEQLYLDEDRSTYIICHALLRIFLSKRIKQKPNKIKIIKDRNKKPYLRNNHMYFNITHTRNAFAFGFSTNCYLGIDMENNNNKMNFLPLLDAVFSNKEKEFVLVDKAKSLDRFLLIWTRKEALLKALGIGLVSYLEQIEVLEDKKPLPIDLIENKLCYTINNKHYVCSYKTGNYCLSVALPQKSKIVLQKIKRQEVSYEF